MAKRSKIPFWLKQWTRLLVLVCIASLILLHNGGEAQANVPQEHILNVGINLGWAKARLDHNGDANSGEAGEIRVALQRAAAHVQAAADLFGEPYLTERRRQGIDRRVIQKINDYFRRAPRLSLRHRSAYINQIWSMYRQSFLSTFMAPGGGVHYYPACDFNVLNVGYHFGRAHIAAGVIGNRARTYQTGANGMMRSAIQSGFKIAADGYDYGPRSNARKACCCFGKQDRWARLPKFEWNSPFELYSQSLPLLQLTVREAGVVPRPCICFNNPQNGDRNGHDPDECRPNTGDIRTGHYTNNLGDSAYIESLGDGNYKISAWHGKENVPSKTDWYNSGKGKMQNGLIHSIQPAVEKHPYQEYEFEGYWKIICPGKIKLEKHRNYLKGQKPNNDVGWKKEGVIYNLVN